MIINEICFLISDTDDIKGPFGYNPTTTPKNYTKGKYVGYDESKPDWAYSISFGTPSIVDNIPQIEIIYTPKNLDEVKIIAIEMIKSEQNKQLSPTDWYAVRKIRIGEDIPDNIISEQTIIYNIGHSVRLSISFANSVSDIVNKFPINWS